MKLKTDSSSIDTLAAHSTAEELSNTLVLFERIRNNDLSDGESLDENIIVLQEAIKKQVDSQIYMFYSYDGLGDEMWELHGFRDWDPEWFGVYRRVGDIMKEVWWFGGSNIHEYDIQAYIKKSWITEVFTWHIQEEFLWIKSRYWTDHNNEQCEMKTDILTNEQIQLLRDLGVNVRILNILV